MKECDLKENLSFCNCTYQPCSRKGKCCECIRYHWKVKELPACFFPASVEKSYDRSLDRFLETYSK
ncbi:MAG: DUF6485 family protein [candidate division Zixibacteria bacterium]|nr:DUF6485 family protein [candidate division Zixibacteria bacterium]